MKSHPMISIRGLGETEQIVFSSLLSLLAFKTKRQWQLTTEPEADLYVVDYDIELGRSIAKQISSHDGAVIYFGQHEFARQQPLYIAKPLRAADILQCLKLWTDNIESGGRLYKAAVKLQPAPDSGRWRSPNRFARWRSGRSPEARSTP